jgi:NAD(P)H-hydrate repair Nnr-like enzyme with NAD(P)H-hydrate dehydratase domain
MQRDYWHRQGSEPLFPDLLWSRPENRAHAGKLFIAGGNLHSFSAAATAFSEAEKAGVGVARVLLPDALQKTVGRVFEAGEYAPSTPSGSFAQTALAEFLELANWADGALLAGDFGRNSETAVLLESFASKYRGQLALVGDAVDYFLTQPDILDRPSTLLVLDFSQMQKLATATKSTTAFRSSLDFLHLVDALHEFSANHQASVVLPHEKTVFATAQGSVSTTQFEKLPSITSLAAHASVWWLQNPTKPFESLTSAVGQSLQSPSEHPAE